VEHDVVIVGAGSAGGTLAERLSEDPGRSVLLLEAGPDHDAAHTPPGIASPNFFGGILTPGRMWDALVARRTAVQAPAFYARGRGAGGSSAVNAMLAMRGTPDDYDRWADAYGCTGWAWRDMRAAFEAVEAGPIGFTRIAEGDTSPFDRAMRRAAIALGHPVCDDYNAPDATGLSFAMLTLRDGRRSSVNDAYVEPARTRANFTSRGGVLVDRVVLDGTRAVGVVTADGEEIAAREVIVSAGAIHSPAILLRSGIGVADGLPVGANLIDHAATAGFEIALRERGRQRRLDAPVVQSVIRYASGLEEAGPNDMQIIWFTAVGPDPEHAAGARAFPAVMRVYSRGTVSLVSDDPRVDPEVDFGMLSDGRDRARLQDGVRHLLDLLRHDAVADVVEQVTAGTTPIDDLATPGAIEEWVYANANDYVHAAGTCAMGSVVDTACRVIGYEGLRACDASVMPDLPKANSHLTTVAIAHRIAETYRRR
jgi:choline dehydrogenase-like flavoprotein